MLSRLFSRNSKDYAYARKCISIVSKQFKKDRKELTLRKKENYVQIFRTIEKFIKDGTFTATETYKILQLKDGLEYLLEKAGVFHEVSVLKHVRQNGELEPTSPTTQDKTQVSTPKAESNSYVDLSKKRGPSPTPSEEHIYEEIYEGSDEEILTLPDYSTFYYLPKEKKRSHKESPSTSQKSKFKPKNPPAPEIETVTSGELQILNIDKYFKDSFDFESLQKMNDREKVEALDNFAQSLEVPVRNFEGEAFTLEYFLLEEQLTKVMDALTKIKCQLTDGSDDYRALRQKKELIEYVRNLLRILESYEDEDGDDE